MQYCIKKNYKANLNPAHHSDENFTDEGQREVYEFCREFMTTHKLTTVLDIGCGSGYKLMHLLGEFNTVGIETEPCYSHLRNKYPDRKWLLSGKPEQNFVDYADDISNVDVIICSDVIEHIVNPDLLVDYMLSFNAKYYIVSTPCREILCNHPKFNNAYHKSINGPPNNKCHVREWTMTEFKAYISTKFNIISSHYGEKQIECQYHLLTKLTADSGVNK